jgi:hypothetical protein
LIRSAATATSTDEHFLKDWMIFNHILEMLYAPSVAPTANIFEF